MNKRSAHGRLSRRRDGTVPFDARPRNELKPPRSDFIVVTGAGCVKPSPIRLVGVRGTRVIFLFEGADLGATVKAEAGSFRLLACLWCEEGGS